jgi:hypothetical protein
VTAEPKSHPWDSLKTDIPEPAPSDEIPEEYQDLPDAPGDSPLPEGDAENEEDMS